MMARLAYWSRRKYYTRPFNSRFHGRSTPVVQQPINGRSSPVHKAFGRLLMTKLTEMPADTAAGLIHPRAAVRTCLLPQIDYAGTHPNDRKPIVYGGPDLARDSL
jgi:hypothetical protein